METKAMDLQKLEKANSIIQVAIELGIKVQGNMGKCFKTDRHVLDGEKPTLFFNLAKNTFHCRECQDVGGTVFDLVCQYRGWERQKAIEWLAHRVEFDEATKKLYHGKGRKKLPLYDNSK
ncbi:MAG: hypothetical protein HY912_01750 [Desulfomonile tiedjei]|uniref:Zinc finger CHC2-type domain-containing protein n=1 Tax=Desulfomonile tiedjei TaxID=2358 RepID=A0A9D6UZX9_9BACT|nr:hypothetical protein [Desulfomonile tiedjei]